MHDLRYYRVMADYNHWMNIKLFSVCADVPDTIRRKDTGAFFKSIHGALNHLVWSDQVWLARFEGRPLDEFKDQQERYQDFQELREVREVLDQKIQEWVNGLSVEWLKQPFSYTSLMDGQVRTLPAWILAVHLFNHQTHHRGQITTLLTQAGYEYGITDLPWLPSLQATE